jgi:hypothetical protein
MARAIPQLNRLPGQLPPVVQAILRAMRKAAQTFLVLWLLWNIALHAPLCCIVHCHIAPWLIARTASHQRLFVCTFDINTDSPLPPASTLPPVIHTATLTLAILLIVILTAVGWLTPALYSFSRYLAPPPTPPPRSA